MESAAQAYQSLSQQLSRDDLIVEHLPLVKQVVGRTLAGLPETADKENLEAAGTLGLVEAAWQFNPERKVKFSTFARHRIYGALIDELRRNCPLPQAMLERWGRVRTILEQNDGVVEIAAIADKLGMTEEEVEDCIVAIRLTQPEAWTEGFGIAPLIDTLENREQLELVTECIMQLEERDRVIITMYHHEGMLQREIGMVLGLSESRICRLLAIAEERLKKLVKVRCGE